MGTGPVIINSRHRLIISNSDATHKGISVIIICHEASVMHSVIRKDMINPPSFKTNIFLRTFNVAVTCSVNFDSASFVLLDDIVFLWFSFEFKSGGFLISSLVSDASDGS